MSIHRPAHFLFNEQLLIPNNAVTESGFDALNIRLGDRRKLQREIARRQLWPENSPLPTPDELRDFTLSLLGNGADTGASKRGFFEPHVADSIESDHMSSEVSSEPRQVVSSLHISTIQIFYSLLPHCEVILLKTNRSRRLLFKTTVQEVCQRHHNPPIQTRLSNQILTTSTSTTPWKGSLPAISPLQTLI